MRTRLGLLIVGLALVGAGVAGCSSTTSGTSGAVQDDATTSPSGVTAAPASSCAEGGACAIGDIGPGNGIVFYVASTPFFSAAPCGTSCTYLEAQTSDAGLVPYCVGPGATASIPNSNAAAIGAGFQNTMSITATSECSSGAGFTAMAPNGGLTDWYLPSLSEGMALYENYAAVGGLEGTYWTSTQANTKQASYVSDTTNTGLTDPKSLDMNVRAIRAF
ncbi:MAG: hypothetical protein ACOYO9_07960 [Candidatus Nanopelagicales bacterium]|jgi:hypothetical protein